MPNQLLIGLGTGVAAALMLLSTTLAPSVISLILSLLSITPVFIAGLGWGLATALVAALTAASLAALIAAPSSGATWLLMQAVPALILIRYAHLNRTTPGSNAPATASAGVSTAQPDNTAQMAVQWYPVGQLVTITALIGGTLAALTMTLIGSSSAVIREEILKAIPVYAKRFPQFNLDKLTDAAMATLADVALFLLPVATAMAIIMILLFNFWLAGRMALGAGVLFRPWPDISAMTVPPILNLGLAIALGATLLSGMPALIAAGFAGALMTAYVCVGLAIIHYITRGSPYRGFILAGLYFALIYLNSFVLIILAMIGLSERISPLRRNFNQPPPPPADDNTST